MQGAVYATAIAEYFRDQGQQVLLLMDSLTRYAMAAREIALAIGEPPATKGYPPSVFATLPQLVERAGNGVRGRRLDHGVLHRAHRRRRPERSDRRRGTRLPRRALRAVATLAESGHYPAIDIEQSVSRVMHNVTDARQQQLARQVKSLWSRYQRSRDLISVGAYVTGTDPETDQSIALNPRIAQMLQQPMNERSTLAQGRDALEALLGPVGDR